MRTHKMKPRPLRLVRSAGRASGQQGFLILQRRVTWPMVREKPPQAIFDTDKI